MKAKAHHILDMEATVLPLSLLKALRAFEQMASGEVLEVRGRDPQTRTDLLRVLQHCAYEVIKEERKAHSYRMLIRKNKAN